jgi:hypothetical protein
MSQTRRLAAILAADVAGYSRLMGADEEGTLEGLKALRHELIDPKVAEPMARQARQGNPITRRARTRGRRGGAARRRARSPSPSPR